MEDMQYAARNGVEAYNREELDWTSPTFMSVQQRKPIFPASSKSVTLPSYPGEDIGFGGGTPGPFQDPSKLASIWKEPNTVEKNEIWVAEMRDRIVGVTRIENKGDELELIDIDVPSENPACRRSNEQLGGQTS